MKPTVEEIKKFLHRETNVTVFDVIDSTNNEAKRRIISSPPRPVLYVARCQTAGRGRRGHTFYSPADTGLYLSLVLPINGRPADIQRITCAAAVATAEAIEALVPVQVGIKWVNDLYINRAKVCGILTELLSDDLNRPVGVCVGIGVNLTTAVFPDGVADIAGSVGEVNPSHLCALIADNLIDYYDQIGKKPFMDNYAARSLVIGRTVRFDDAQGTHTALAVGISADGGLVVEEAGVERTLLSGEVSVRI